MRTAKLEALAAVLPARPHLRFAAVTFEALLEDSEAALREVLAGAGLGTPPWREPEYWKERRPQDGEW